MRLGLFLLIALIFYTAPLFALTLSSPAFTNNGKYPDVYTCEGKGISPPLIWQDVPPNTRSFTLIFSSQDSPLGLIYLWVLYNIPPTVTQIGEDGKELPDEVMIGNNSLQEAKYKGPCPPDGENHHYIFTLYALDEMLDLQNEADIADIFKEMKNHIIQETKYVGVFSH